MAAYPQQQFAGVIQAISPRVDNQTRNLQVRASLANPDGKLLPGMFANIEVELPDTTQRVVVPETAVAFTLYGNSVYVVVPKKDDSGKPVNDAKGQPELTVERRFIKVGERREGTVVILDGLKVGEQVVTSGQLKLDSGTPVAITADVR